MKTTSSAAASWKSLRETILPLTASGRLKSGATVPSGSIVELTATIAAIWDGIKRLSNRNLRHGEWRGRLDTMTNSVTKRRDKLSCRQPPLQPAGPPYFQNSGRIDA